MGKILYETDKVCIEFFSGNVYTGRLIFVFSPFMNRILTGNPYGGDLFCKNDFDVVSFKLTSDDWYQSIPIKVLDDLVERAEVYDYVVGYGSSMGGYAVLCFSRLLSFDVGVLFSPQVAVDADFDKRWIKYVQGLNWIYRIDRSTVASNTRFICAYDNKSQDAIHVEKLRDIVSDNLLVEIKLPYSGHPSLDYINELGLLKDFAVCSVNGKSFDIKKLRYARRRSKSYLFNLSISTLQRKKYRISLFLINLAIELDVRNFSFLIHKSLILERAGRLAEALSCCIDFFETYDGGGKLCARIGNIQFKLGLLLDALANTEKAISLGEDCTAQLNCIKRAFEL